MKLPEIKGYEIQKQLGKGGMGAVYLARQISLNRLVAIKILPEHLTDNATYVMRFRMEAKAAAKLKHVNLVQIYDAGVENDLFYFVMEYINGETAGHRVHRKGRLDEETTLLIAESVAVALEHAWDTAQLVHRDVKPDNILIDGDGTVKVVDLGLAKIMGTGAGAITMTKTMIGTPYYCAPEQAQGALEIDSRADIYALGATMYHLATGYAPFADTSGVSAMVRNVTDFVCDPLERNPNLSTNFAWLLETMMAKDPGHRPADWTTALADIERVLHGKMPNTAPPPAGTSTVARGERKKARPHPCPRIKPQPPAATTTTSSRMFRVFLVLATAVTVLLCAVWLSLEIKRHRSETLPLTGGNESTIAQESPTL